MGNITSITLTPTPAGTGQTSSHLIDFTTASTLPLDGKIVVTYPAGFNVSAATPTSVSINGGFTVSVTGQVVTVTRDGTGTATAAGALDLTLGGIVNTTVVGSYTVSVATQTHTGAAIDGPNNSASFSITGGALTSVSDTPATTTAGSVTNHALAFTTQSTVPNNGKVVVTFPAGFNVAGAGVASSSMSGGFTTSVLGQVVTVTRTGTGTATAPGALTLTLSGIGNSPTTGSYTVSIATQDGSGGAIDGPTTSSSFSITGGTVRNVTATPEPSTFSQTAEYIIGFTTASTLPNNGKIAITFPAGFNVSGATLVSASYDGGSSVGVAGQVVTITRDGTGTATAPGSISLTLGTIVNPAVAGGYTLTVSTETATSTTIDAAGTSATFDISGSVLSAVSVTPLDDTPHAVTSYVIQFSTSMTWPANGQLAILFPRVFDVIPVTAAPANAALTGGLSTRVDPNTGLITIYRDGTGTSLPAGTYSVRLFNVRNPSVINAYFLTIQTQDSTGSAIDIAALLPSWMVGDFPPIHSRILGTNEWEIFRLPVIFNPTQIVVTNAMGANNAFRISGGPDADHVVADPNPTAINGTVTLTAGSNAVVGIGTSFLSQAPAGSTVALLDGKVLGVVASVTDDTHLTLVDPWGGVTVSGATLYNATPHNYYLAPHQSMVFPLPIGGAPQRLFTEVFALGGPILFTLEGPDGILFVVRNSTTEKQL